MNPVISIVICSHNPQPAYLDRVIEALKVQTLPRTQWELLLVDNASLLPLADSIDLSWHPHARHILEPQLGTVFARFRGLKESQGAISIFVDDDNVLDPSYLHHALKISENHPHLGVWGGQSTADFQGGTPEDWTHPMWPLLAIIQFDKDAWSNLDLTETMPVGAGMCIRKPVAQKYIDLVQSDPRRLSLGQRGELLLRCEDFDIALAALDVELGLGRFSRLKLVHIMPIERLSEGYLLKLVKGIVYSRAIMDFLRNRPQAQLSWRTKVRYFLSSWLMSPRDRRFLKATKQAQDLAAKQIQKMQVDPDDSSVALPVYQHVKI
ncbi:MAG: glycosyltransferase [Nostoc sp.]|uniref:glycosyltransferase n=1 Tax=Nostoc sp. TaxID=1180 RepID=UPI002FF785D5